MKSTSSVIRDLAVWGPDAAVAQSIDVSAARAYCQRLACSHYENFTVVSWLLPRTLRQHFYNVYAYCRWADDLADETGNAQQSSRLLTWWERELDACYQGEVRHPVFMALRETILEFGIPKHPFCNLLTAFRQDQTQTRYATTAELIGYCQNSANPVGQLILYLGRCHNDATAKLSDFVCTGLQLANFCQDVARDYERGRIYLPVESWQKYGCDDATFANRQAGQPFRQLLAYEVQRATDFLVAGWPLVQQVPRELRFDVSLFIRGGLGILKAIERQQYDVWSRRPKLSKFDKLVLILQAWWTAR